jgi:hypothetical protein
MKAYASVIAKGYAFILCLSFLHSPYSVPEWKSGHKAEVFFEARKGFRLCVN